jgi:hypothetical protein
MAKVYFHHEGPEQFSKVFKISPDTCPQDLLGRFVTAYNFKFGADRLSSAALELRSMTGRLVSPLTKFVETDVVDVNVVKVAQ